MTLQLHLKLKSDLAPGVGEGGVGSIDREIVYTAEGIPIITARRLKGCLREATLEIIEVLDHALPGANPYPRQWLDELFGRPGQITSSWLWLDNAYPKGMADLENWLKWAVAQDANVFGSTALQDIFTGTRAQTSISRHSGGALQNTLRISRVISRTNTYSNAKDGQIFVANLSLVKPLEESTNVNEADLTELLALGCAAFRHLGLSRNRGLGEVTVWLEEDGKNLTEEIVKTKLKSKLGIK
jgi:CRISPR-associated protein Csx10